VDALRLLVPDLQALVDRLALAEDPEHGNPEHKKDSPRFVQTVKAAQKRVAGPRAVVMLLSEHALLKRHFLERLLGPLPNLPEPLAELVTESMRGPVRLEYGPAPERVAPTSEQAIPVLRLPTPTLKRGLAVIDTPAIETPAIEDSLAIEDAATTDGRGAVSVLWCAQQANAWIFVLAADHAIGKAAQTLLRQLPEQASGLEFVVEGAEALNATARGAAREQLLQTLRENCGIAEPRLTLIASAATEGDEGSYWHGRFATFHTVMMLRGRERWLQATRALIAAAMNDVGAEIEQELKNSVPGLRHARLRLGLKDLEGLRTRFHELGRPEGDAPGETASASSSTQASSTTDVPAPATQWQPLATESVAPIAPPVDRPDTAAEVFLSEREARELLESQALRAPRGLRAKLVRLLPFSRPTFRGMGTAAAAQVSAGVKGSTRPWRLLGGVWALAFLVIALWIMWPRLAAEHESAAEWDLRQQSAPLAPKPAPATPRPMEPSLVVPAVHAETEHAGVRDTVSLPSRTRANTVIRTPLAKPVPQGLTAGAAPPRRHHGFLGIGRLWGWVRHPLSSSSQHSNAGPTATNE
jgi:hypothetical protein